MPRLVGVKVILSIMEDDGTVDEMVPLDVRETPSRSLNVEIAQNQHTEKKGTGTVFTGKSSFEMKAIIKEPPSHFN